jgi:hypothetical protein
VHAVTLAAQTEHLGAFAADGSDAALALRQSCAELMLAGAERRAGAGPLAACLTGEAL